MRPTFVAPTRERAWELAAEPLRYMASGYMQWTAEADVASGAPSQTAVLPSVEEIIRKQSFDFFTERALIGTPDDVIAQIAEYRSRSRLTDLVCGMALPGMPAEQIRAGMELFAREVIPHFRGP
jgi:alkanesulfonate monooxygenase SsuD/methylene tetrahydromethanopterin reductase-like flavin-dependent oxidoreductase (luciferase family)